MYDEIQGKLINSIQCSMQTAYLLSQFDTCQCQLQNYKEHTCNICDLCEI